MKPTYRRSWPGNLLMFQILPWTPRSSSSDGLLNFVSCLFSGYKFASVLQCLGLILGLGKV